MDHNLDSDAGNSSEGNTNDSCHLKPGILDGDISDSTSFENENTRSELNFDEFPETEEEEEESQQKKNKSESSEDEDIGNESSDSENNNAETSESDSRNSDTSKSPLPEHELEQNNIKQLVKEVATLQANLKKKQERLESLQSMSFYIETHNLEELRDETSKIKRGCQEALIYLFAGLRKQSNTEFTMRTLLEFMKIPSELVGYNEEFDAFT